MANPENAYNDNRPLVIGGAYKSRQILTAAQGVLAPGTVLGVVTATGALLVCAAASVDGSEVARYILAGGDDVDTGDPNQLVQDVIKAGVVNGNLLIFGGADTLATRNAVSGLSHDENLKANGIITLSGAALEAYDNT